MSRQRTSPVVPRYSWDIAVFKVEDRLFRVARQELVKESPIFEAMFSLPTGESDGEKKTEGQTNENPIVLEGYKSDDFEALLRLLYPTFDDLVNGPTLSMEKRQWIGVLRLSTVWGMGKIRKHAIATLSGAPFNLTPVEKVTLAREHRVGPWLEEGVRDLVREDHELSLDELEAAVGLRTAYRIVGLRAQASASRSIPRPCRVGGGFMPTLPLGELKCSSCNTSPFGMDLLSCNSCRASMNDVAIQPSSDSLVKSDASSVFYEIELRDLLCTECQKGVVGKTVTCVSCRVVTPATGHFRFMLGCTSLRCDRETIQSTFHDELKDIQGSD